MRELTDRLAFTLADATPTLVIGGAVLAALLAHALLMRLARRIARRSPGKTDDLIIARVGQPLRWIFPVIAIVVARRAIPVEPRLETLWQSAAGFIVPALFGWFAIALVRAFKDIVELNADLAAADNLRARRKRTRVGILARITTFLILFLTVCTMLLSVPGVRSVGVTLMASAGIIGLVVGAAAQPLLKNLLAGVQMAFTEPIRLDDVVVIAGEWGRIEEIRLTYVVVRLWDERRLVVPVSKFLEDSFQNWTRDTSQLLGSAMIYVDPTADVPRLRAHAADLAAANPLWDRRFTNLQVIDVRETVMELRILVTASDASRAFDLRCDMREALMAFLRDEMPHALPRRRIAALRDETERAMLPDG